MIGHGTDVHVLMWNSEKSLLNQEDEERRLITLFQSILTASIKDRVLGSFVFTELNHCMVQLCEIGLIYLGSIAHLSSSINRSSQL